MSPSCQMALLQDPSGHGAMSLDSLAEHIDNGKVCIWGFDLTEANDTKDALGHAVRSGRLQALYSCPRSEAHRYASSLRK